MITLDKHYTITPDAACWTLTYSKTGSVNPKTGKPIVSTDSSYHMNLKQALWTYLDQCLKPATGIDQLYATIVEVERRISCIQNI